MLLKAWLTNSFFFLQTYHWLQKFEYTSSPGFKDCPSFFNLYFLSSPESWGWGFMLGMFFCNSWNWFHIFKEIPEGHASYAFTFSSVLVFAPSIKKSEIWFSNYPTFLFLWVQASSLEFKATSFHLGQEEAVHATSSLKVQILKKTALERYTFSAWWLYYT